MGKGSEGIQRLKKLEPPEFIKVRSLYFTFGRFDAVIVFEAPSPQIGMRFVTDSGFMADFTVETLTAVPTEEL